MNIISGKCAPLVESDSPAWLPSINMGTLKKYDGHKRYERRINRNLKSKMHPTDTNNNTKTKELNTTDNNEPQTLASSSIGKKK